MSFNTIRFMSIVSYISISCINTSVPGTIFLVTFKSMSDLFCQARSDIMSTSLDLISFYVFRNVSMGSLCSFQSSSSYERSHIYIIFTAFHPHPTSHNMKCVIPIYQTVTPYYMARSQFQTNLRKKEAKTIASDH